MALPASAIATVKSYELKHPKREHCRAHYSREVKTVKVRKHGKTSRVRQVWCVYKPPATHPATPTPRSRSSPTSGGPTPTGPRMPTGSVATTTHLAVTPGPTFDAHLITAYASHLVGSEPRELRSEQLTFTIVDRQTEQAIGSFGGVSNGSASCGIAWAPEKPGFTTFVGRAEGASPACALGRASLPVSHEAAIGASFAGNATYAASSTEWERLPALNLTLPPGV